MFNDVIGIDVGHTNIKMMAIVNGKTILKTIPSGDKLTRQELINNIHDYYLSFKHDFKGIGIAFSGGTADSKKVDYTSLPCLKNLSVEDFSRLNTNISLINDADAATIGGTVEFPNSKVLVGFTNGTGIGCGIAVNGNLFTGSSGFTGEIHENPIISENGNIIKIGQLCSGSMILKKLNLAKTDVEKFQIIQDASMYCGILLSQIIHMYNPDTIVFSGGGFQFPNFLSESINFAKKHCYSKFTQNLTFVSSKYYGYAGCMGAIKLVSSSK